MNRPRGLNSQRSITLEEPEAAAGEVEAAADPEAEAPGAGRSPGRVLVATIWPSPLQTAVPNVPGSARRLSPRKVRLALAKEDADTGGCGEGAVTKRTMTGVGEGLGGAGATLTLGRGAATGAGRSSRCSWCSRPAGGAGLRPGSGPPTGLCTGWRAGSRSRPRPRC